MASDGETGQEVASGNEKGQETETGEDRTGREMANGDGGMNWQSTGPWDCGTSRDSR